MDINLLIEPWGSESNKSEASIASKSTEATRTHSTSEPPRPISPAQDCPIFPTISELQQHQDRSHKRAASQIPLTKESPAKEQHEWTPEEDNLTIELRGQGRKWDDIAKRFPERSAISCRLRYQNYLEKQVIWDEGKKNKLSLLYARFKNDMWQEVATEMGIPWRTAESMHWQLGEQEISARAITPEQAPTGPIDSNSTINLSVMTPPPEPPPQIGITSMRSHVQAHPQSPTLVNTTTMLPPGTTTTNGSDRVKYLKFRRADGTTNSWEPLDYESEGN